MKIDGIEVPEISQNDLMELLKDEENLLIYGNKGVGKSSIVREYAKASGKKLLMFSLATMLPEYLGGIPYANISESEKTEYFTLLLSKQLEPLLKVKGKGWILDFDEITQASTEVLNCLYSICHIDPKQREWCGHSLEFVQIVAQSNLNDGTDGTVYLNELPTPLHDRFFICQLVNSSQDTYNYLKNKYKHIPQIEKYIKIIQDSPQPINPRNIDKCLELLEHKKNPLLLRAKLGTALTQKVLDIQKGVENRDPTKLLRGVKEAYKCFQRDKIIAWGKETITSEAQLLAKFKELITEEEIASIIESVKKEGSKE